MALINGIGNVGYRPVTFTSTEPREADTQVVTVVPQPKEEKKSKHTVLKVLTAAAVVAGAVLLFKNRGKVVGKINTLIDRLKPVKPQVKPATPEGLDEIAGVVKKTSKSPITERIESMVGLDKPVKSAQESMGVFVKNDVGKALSQKPVVTAETIDAGLVANESGKLAQDFASVFEKFGLTEYEKSLASAQKKTKAIVPGNKNGSVTVAKPQGTSSQTTAPVVLPDKAAAPKTPKTGRKEYYEPSKNEVVREHTALVQGEKIKPRSKTNSRKIRHNKRQIIDQTLVQEQAEFAPMFKGKEKTKIQHPVRRQAKPEQIMSRVTAPKVETPQYKYPEAVYKYETEMATKQKAADIKAAWKEYEHRKIYGE